MTAHAWVPEDQTKPYLHLDGFDVHLYRDKLDGHLTVAVYTENATGEDVQPVYSVPRLRLIVNDCREDLDADGDWIREGGE